MTLTTIAHARVRLRTWTLMRACMATRSRPLTCPPMPAERLPRRPRPGDRKFHCRCCGGWVISAHGVPDPRYRAHQRVSTPDSRRCGALRGSAVDGTLCEAGAPSLRLAASGLDAMTAAWLIGLRLRGVLPCAKPPIRDLRWTGVPALVCARHHRRVLTVDGAVVGGRTGGRRAPSRRQWQSCSARQDDPATAVAPAHRLTLIRWTSAR